MKTKTKWTEQDIKKKMEAGTLPAIQTSLLDITSDVLTNDHKADGEYIHLVELMQQGHAFFFPLNVPSLKNSQEIKKFYTGKSECCKAPYTKLAIKKYQCNACQQICQLQKTTVLGMSDRAKEYMNTVIPMIEKKQRELHSIISQIGYPIHMGLYFIRESEHEFDFDNAITMVADCIKKKIIKDDSMIHVYFYALGYHVDKVNPGFIMTFIKKPIYDYYELKQQIIKQETFIIPDIL